MKKTIQFLMITILCAGAQMHTLPIKKSALTALALLASNTTVDCGDIVLPGMSCTLQGSEQPLLVDDDMTVLSLN